MSDVSQILKQIDAGNAKVARHLLPLLLVKFRQLTAQQFVSKLPGLTLSTTALVQDTYLKFGTHGSESRNCFLRAAAVAMRHTLLDFAAQEATCPPTSRSCAIFLGDVIRLDGPAKILPIDQAVSRMALAEPLNAELVQLRLFAGLTIFESAQTMQIELRSAERQWLAARAWLQQEMAAEKLEFW